MQAFDFSPFYRSTVGFDNLFSRLDGLVGQESKSYPPYNIEKVGEDGWRVTVAVAGFAADEIDVEVKENNLTIKGAKNTGTEQTDREFLHRGIAERSFELRYQLGDYVEVVSADIVNGLLNIDLKREVPENKRARRIDIKSGDSAQTIEDKSVN